MQKFPWGTGEFIALNMFAWGITLALHAACFSYAGMLVARCSIGIFTAAISPGFSMSYLGSQVLLTPFSDQSGACWLTWHLLSQSDWTILPGEGNGYTHNALVYHDEWADPGIRLAAQLRTAKAARGKDRALA